MSNKELALDPKYTFQLAGWYLTKHDKGDITKIISGTPDLALKEFNIIGVKVNGTNKKTGLPNGYEERMKYFRDTLETLNVEGREVIIQQIDAKLSK